MGGGVVSFSLPLFVSSALRWCRSCTSLYFVAYLSKHRAYSLESRKSFVRSRETPSSTLYLFGSFVLFSQRRFAKGFDLFVNALIHFSDLNEEKVFHKRQREREGRTSLTIDSTISCVFLAIACLARADFFLNDRREMKSEVRSNGLVSFRSQMVFLFFLLFVRRVFDAFHFPRRERRKVENLVDSTDLLVENSPERFLLRVVFVLNRVLQLVVILKSNGR